MENTPTYRLSCTVRSSSKAHVVYGKQGEEVRLIADHGEVLIVKGECGSFPVHIRDIADLDAILPEDQAAFVPQKAPTKKASTKKQATITNTLF